MDIQNFQNQLKSIVESFSAKDEVKILEELVKELKVFIQYIEETDKNAADKILKELETTSDNSLFREVGKLLRRFHDQLVLIREGIPEDLGKIASQDVVEMSERLQMIVTMTDKAANTTLDLTEEIMDSISQQNESMTNIVDQLNILANDEKSPPALTKSLKSTMNQIQAMADNNNGLQDKLTNILIAQDYQDLTGQVIFKVINLLKSLESDLAQLIDRFGQALAEETEPEEARLKGPLQENHDDKVSQSDVDSLLTKFGF